MAQDELRAAGLANAEECPFCDYVAILENDADRVFACLNPDCLKQSCRLVQSSPLRTDRRDGAWCRECKEESHVPLKCSEVEKSAEVRIRTHVENAMAEAMIRVCPKCKHRSLPLHAVS